MIIGSRHPKHYRLMLVRSATLLLILIVSFLGVGATTDFGGCPQDSNLSQSQRSSLQEIIGAARGNRGSRKAKGVGVLFTCSENKEQAAAAKILANELRGDLYRVDLSKIVGKYIGETEKNLRQVFATAQARQSILFFDQADALLGKRTEVKDSHDRFANVEANYLLQQIEEYHGIAILSVARKQNIDPAFTRRLRFVVEFC